MQQAQLLLAEQGVAVTLHPTLAVGDAYRYAQEVAPRVDAILTIGGDGTLNEVINGIVESGTSTPLAILPAGTANVMAKELGLPRRLEEQIAIALEGEIRQIDLGVVTWYDTNGEKKSRRFAMCAGIGFDAAIVDRVAKKRDATGITIWTYLVPTLGVVWRYDYPRLRITVDGVAMSADIEGEARPSPGSLFENSGIESGKGAQHPSRAFFPPPPCKGEARQRDITFVVIGNMRHYGGPFSFFTDADPSDGLLDVCCLSPTRFSDFFRYGWHCFWGTLSQDRTVTYCRGKQIQLEADRPTSFQVDGDPGGVLPLSIEVLPRAVGFCVSP